MKPGPGLAVGIVAALLAGTAGAAAPRATGPAPSDVRRVLFIGNSLTYGNDLPRTYAAICAAAGRPVQAEMIAEGAATLTRHRRNPAVEEAIRSGRWDAVVLQDQSSRPAVDPKGTVDDAEALGAVIRASGAVPVMYMTWGLAEPGGQRMDDSAQRMLARAYGEAARAAGGCVAPVGLAWRSALAGKPTLRLYADDGVHPTPAGTYLAACVFYHTLHGAGAPVRSAPWKSSAPAWPLRWTLTDGDAAYLERVAAETVRGFDLKAMLKSLAPVAVTPEELRAILKPGFTRPDAIRRFGQMIEMDQDHRLAWTREGGGQLCLVWTPDGRLEKAILHAPGRDFLEIPVE